VAGGDDGADQASGDVAEHRDGHQYEHHDDRQDRHQAVIALSRGSAAEMERRRERAGFPGVQLGADQLSPESVLAAAPLKDRLVLHV